MTAYTVSDIVTRVKRQFGDESGVQVTDADVYRWINDAQREIVSQHDGLLNKVAFITTIANWGSYELGVNGYPADLLTIKEISYRATNDTSQVYLPLRYLTRQAVREYGIEHDESSPAGVPEFWYKGNSHTTITLYPVPEVSYTNALKIRYSRYPIDIVDSSSTIDLPEYYNLVILEYCLMKAYEMDEDWESADKKAAYVQSTINSTINREEWFDRNTYPVIFPTSEDYI